MNKILIISFLIISNSCYSFEFLSKLKNLGSCECRDKNFEKECRVEGKKIKEIEILAREGIYENEELVKLKLAVEWPTKCECLFFGQSDSCKQRGVIYQKDSMDNLKEFIDTHKTEIESRISMFESKKDEISKKRDACLEYNKCEQSITMAKKYNCLKRPKDCLYHAQTFDEYLKYIEENRADEFNEIVAIHDQMSSCKCWVELKRDMTNRYESIEYFISLKNQQIRAQKDLEIAEAKKEEIREVELKKQEEQASQRKNELIKKQNSPLCKTLITKLRYCDTLGVFTTINNELTFRKARGSANRHFMANWVSANKEWGDKLESTSKELEKYGIKEIDCQLVSLRGSGWTEVSVLSKTLNAEYVKNCN